MQGKSRWSILVLGMALATAVHADAFADLRTTLAHLQGGGPFAGTLVARSTVTEGSKPKTTQAQVQVSVASDAQGLHIGFAPALLERSEREAAAQAKNPDAPAPTLGLLGRITPVKLQSMLDMGPTLLRDLEGATLREQHDEVHDGKPAHLLVFDVPPGVGADDRDAIKHYEGTLRVWLGADGVPVATAEQRQYKGRKFLISFQFGNSVTTRLQRVGTRLVAVSRHAQNTGSGFGQSSDSVTDDTLTPAP